MTGNAIERRIESGVHLLVVLRLKDRDTGHTRSELALDLRDIALTPGQNRTLQRPEDRFQFLIGRRTEGYPERAVGNGLRERHGRDDTDDATTLASDIDEFP